MIFHIKSSPEWTLQSSGDGQSHLESVIQGQSAVYCDQTCAILGWRPWWPGGDLHDPPLDQLLESGPVWADAAEAAKADADELITQRPKRRKE